MKYIATFLLLGILATNSIAQPSTDVPVSISSPDFIFYINHNPNAITTFTCVNPIALTPVLNSGDTNAVWDFSIANYTQNPAMSEMDSFMLPAGTPLADDSALITSNAVIRTTLPDASVQYQFFGFANSDTSVIAKQLAFKLGVTDSTSRGDRKIITWDPPYKEAEYPMTLHSSWQSASIISGDTLQVGESRIVASSSVVDEWGNLLLPSYTAHPQRALRVRKQTVETISFNGAVSSIDTTNQLIYYTNGLLSATLTLDVNNTIKTATYTVNQIPSSSVIFSAPSDEFGITISENPATSSITKIIYTVKNTSPVRVELMDVLGKSVRMLQNGSAVAGQNIIALDPATLSNGTYFVRVEADGVNAMKKFVVSH